MRVLPAVLVAPLSVLPCTAVRGAVGDAVAGAALFERECAVCHGREGLGDGPAAELLDPWPRNFDKGLFKIRSTESGELPTDDDLARTLTRGMPGAGMPSFVHLGESAVADLVAFVKTLGGPPDEEGSWFELYEVPPPVEVPPSPPVTAETVAAGERLYVKLGCDTCHGKTGAGDGKRPEELLDSWQRPIHVASFHLGVYKGGSSPEDLYRRIMTGMDGSPMGAFWKDVLAPDERWSLVHYLLSLGQPRRVEQPARGEVEVAAGSPPSRADDPLWPRVPASRVGRMPLLGGWIRSFEPFEVRAVADDTRLALRVGWQDGAAASCAELRVHFSGPESTPTFGLGSPEQPLLAWRWRGGELAVGELAGPGAWRPLESAIEGDAAASEGPHRAVVLRGPRPGGARFVLLTLAGCEDAGPYLTASTFYALRFEGAAGGG